MKVLDRYIFQTLLVSLAIVLVSVLGLALTIDLFFNMDEFLEATEGAEDVTAWAILANMGDYYFYKLFDYLQLLAGPWLLFSGAATLARFNQSRELTGIKAAGVSMYRVLWPMIAIAMAAAVLYVVNQEVIIPRIAVRLLRDPDDVAVREAFSVDFVRDRHNNVLVAPRYDPERREMRAQRKRVPEGDVRYEALVRIFLRDEGYQPLGTIEATRASWDPEQRAWLLKDGRRYGVRAEAPLLSGVPRTDPGEPCPRYPADDWTDVGPRTIERHRAHDFYKYLSYVELRDLARDPMRGNRRAMQVELHQHVTDPLMLVLLMLLGLPLLVGKEERSYMISIGLAVLVVLGILVIEFASTAFGTSGDLDPLLAAWVPVFIVLPAGVLSLQTLRT
jgi:lipopolysaccharide export system permease protein